MTKLDEVIEEDRKEWQRMSADEMLNRVYQLHRRITEELFNSGVTPILAIAVLEAVKRDVYRLTDMLGDVLEHG